MKASTKYYGLSFLEGLGVLTAELLGAKMLAPFFGSSIFIWTVVIGITLLCLSAGYYLGSRLATRKDAENVIFFLFAIGTFFLCLMPLTTHIFFKIFSGINIFAGVGFSTLLLLGPPLIALGATSPILIQRITSAVEDAGEVAGNVYAISTLGGITVTFLLGFWIIPSWGISMPILVISVLLLALSNLFLRPDKLWLRIGLSALILLPVGISLLRSTAIASEVSVIYEEEGILGQLKVIDTKAAEQGVRARKMLVNGIPQTNVVKGNYESRSFFNYVHMIATLASMKPPGSKVLTCGMGGGSLLMEFSRLGFDADAVDIDGRQLELASRYFYLDPAAVNFHIDDARHYIATTETRYDIIVLDLLVAEGQPEHLFSLEAFQLIRQKLNADGLLLLNFQGYFHGPQGVAARSIFRTLTEAGFETYAIPAKESMVSDIVFIASPEPVDFSRLQPDRINTCCKEISSTEVFAENPLKYIVRAPDLSDTYLLHDDQPILDMLRVQTILEFRQNKIKAIARKELEGNQRLFR